MFKEIKELVEEVIGFIEEDGYKVLDVLSYDYNRSVKLVVTKAGSKSILPIVNCFYDTDSEGERRTKFHGVVDIRETPWYKNKRAG